ncbi:hypothetical protein SPI_03452 [Niveomyces insectorum RCEF 264]|uniref:Uncharacterized protein n=1 Tax=Niveomyces insectorum RCEF 264 TaxID=1081102 RepID=A0A167W3F1_9HYPO|nr:hypothetical protein SPI_03452 [Niveomyces insectorum RCEF 264]
MSTPSESLITAYYRAGRLVEVLMDGIDFVDFQVLSAIGTRNLNSCSVVVITSEKGAILAHIPPRPCYASATDPFAGDNYAREMMSRVQELYERGVTHGYFAAAPSSGHVVCAILESKTALPDQVAIIQNALHDIGLDSATHTYKVPVVRNVVGYGTVMVVSDGQPGRMPSVYVDVTNPSLSRAELMAILERDKTGGYTTDIGGYAFGEGGG